MVEFKDEHKEEGGNYFGQGVHKVKIMLVEFGETDGGKEYVEFTVSNDEGVKEGTARMWFTTDKAIKYTFNQIRNIFVHNAPEDKKEEVRKKFDKIKNTEELEKACEKLIGAEVWYEVYENPERTYVGNDGKERNSYDKNIYGYEPTPREVTTKDAQSSDTGKTSESTKDEDPFPDF